LWGYHSCAWYRQWHWLIRQQSNDAAGYAAAVAGNAWLVCCDACEGVFQQGVALVKGPRYDRLLAHEEDVKGKVYELHWGERSSSSSNTCEVDGRREAGCGSMQRLMILGIFPATKMLKAKQMS
jgi:hypothetical protein